MKPAVCGVCGISAIQSRTGDWVTFSDYRGVDNEEIGHLEGLEWFCESHLEEAKLLSDQKSSEALAKLQHQYPATSNIKTNVKKTHWWQRLVDRKS